MYSNLYNLILEGSGSLGRRTRVANFLRKKLDTGSTPAKTYYALMTARARAKGQRTANNMLGRYDKPETVKNYSIGNKYRVRVFTKHKSPDESGRGKKDKEWYLFRKKAIGAGKGVAKTYGSLGQTKTADIEPSHRGKDLYPRILRLLKNRVLGTRTIQPDFQLSTPAQKAWKKATGNTYDKYGDMTSPGKYNRKNLKPLKKPIGGTPF